LKLRAPGTPPQIAAQLTAQSRLDGVLAEGRML